MKIYVLIVSKTFPSKHKRAGEPTYFAEKIFLEKCSKGIKVKITEEHGPDLISKKHTIRANYDLWKKRIDKVNEGKAVISVRYWSEKPYKSPQVEFMKLSQGEVGYQLLEFSASGLIGMIMIDRGFPVHGAYYLEDIAKNDGLSEDDFRDWFKGYDLSKPMIIIHFTKFRY